MRKRERGRESMRKRERERGRKCVYRFVVVKRDWA